MAFTSKGSVFVFLLGYNPNVVLDDIPDYFITAAEQEINNRTDTQWEIDSSDVTILLDGSGTKFIHVNTVPIVSLTEVVLIFFDETEESLDISGANRNIRFNVETGVIERIQSSNNTLIERGDDPLRGSVFLEGTANVRIVGKFGRSATDVEDILRLIANLSILRMMTFKDPSKFKANIIKEKIGKYDYMIGAKGRATGDNEILNLDGYINYLYSVLPQDDALFIEAV